MKLLPRHRTAAPGDSKGGISLSDKEQLGVDSEVIQFIPPTKQCSPQALQWRGGLGITKAFRREMFLLLWLPHPCLLPALGWEAGEGRSWEPGCCQEKDVAFKQAIPHRGRLMVQLSARTLQVIREAVRRLNNLAK